MATRPAPLTSRPDAELARLFQDGDADALDVLLTRYRRFARSRSRSYFLMGGDAEDLEQEALIGLYKAVRDYRPEHEVAFRPFAELCITRQLLSAIKTANRQKHQPLNTSVSLHGDRRDASDGEGRTLEERLPSPTPTDDPLERLVGDEQVAVLADAVASDLSELEVRVLRLYVAGRSYVDIAEEVGRHAKSVDNAVQRIKRKLGRSLADYEARSQAVLV
jgi:RNA polymerase sporulation-specific sigma factor